MVENLPRFLDCLSLHNSGMGGILGCIFQVPGGIDGIIESDDPTRV